MQGKSCDFRAVCSEHPISLIDVTVLTVTQRELGRPGGQTTMSVQKQSGNIQVADSLPEKTYFHISQAGQAAIFKVPAASLLDRLTHQQQCMHLVVSSS